MANFCTNCGRELTPGAVFCENCGVKNEVGAPAPQQTGEVPQKKTNGCAIAGFIMSLLCGCLSPVALILSIIGISKSKTTGTGKGLAIAGTIISALGYTPVQNAGVTSISTGASNGTISVTTNGSSSTVAVKGLGSAAYTSSDDYLGTVL
jgi:hypothetical protein